MNRHYCKVTAYSGYKANERPLSFTIDDNRLEIKDIICRWVEPEKDFFKVIADDDRVYTLRWNTGGLRLTSNKVMHLPEIS